MKRLQTAVIDGKKVRVETPQHQNERLANALKRWENKEGK